MSIRKQYDSDLEALKTALVEMGQNAAEAVENALEALCTADTAAAQKIVQGDDRINNMERDIEHRCMTLLLRQQPVAGDLRHISTAMKVVTDIERIADQAKVVGDSVHSFLRDLFVAMAIIIVYLEGFDPGVARLQALTAVQLELAFMFIILGATGLSKKLNTLMPPAVKAGIVLGAGVNAVYVRLQQGGALDTVTVGKATRI